MASTSQPPSVYSPENCMLCHQSLRIATGADPDSESEHPGEPSTVLDDVELYCGPSGSGPGGHHAHWSCLVEHAMQARTRGIVLPPAAAPMSMPGGAYPPKFTTCLVCGQNVLNPSGRFIVDVQNEGGETKGFDFGMIIVRTPVVFSFSLFLCPPLSPSSTRARHGADSNRTWIFPSTSPTSMASPMWTPLTWNLHG